MKDNIQNFNFTLTLYQLLKQIMHYSIIFFAGSQIKTMFILYFNHNTQRCNTIELTTSYQHFLLKFA